jgi:hypothetical protein
VRRHWLLIVLCAAGACHADPDPRQTGFVVDKGRVKAHYDPKSGRLKRLEVDLNKNGVIDSWSYMDGTRVDRVELDPNEDGRIDRWEHYADGKLSSVGSSTRSDGVEDQWAYQDAGGHLARVETDTDRDGQIDKWEVYDPPPAPGQPAVLRSVAYDQRHTGHPTLRLWYRADGSFEKTEHLS